MSRLMHTHRGRGLVALLSTLFIGGCGGIVAPGYRGDPIFSVFASAEPVPVDVRTTVRVRWFDDRATEDVAAASLFDITTAADLIVDGAFPRSFVLQFLAPPPDAALRSSLDSGPITQGALGLITVEVDGALGLELLQNSNDTLVAFFDDADSVDAATDS